MSKTSANSDILGNLVFKLTLPEKIPSYEILVKSKLQDGCRNFSINFCNDESIVYHFGLYEKKLYQGARDGSSWRSRKCCDDWEHPKSGIVEERFRFEDKAQVEHNGCSYDFSHEIPFNAIRRLELRGDIKSVQELTFRWIGGQSK